MKLLTATDATKHRNLDTLAYKIEFIWENETKTLEIRLEGRAIIRSYVGSLRYK
jgi:hypothetical protein